jgi:uncharacterized membrane protein
MRAALMLNKSRIEALGDGVFSITMTLRVLKLDAPEACITTRRCSSSWSHPGPQFTTYVVTFLIAGGFWFLHDLTFHFICHANGALAGLAQLAFLDVRRLAAVSARLRATC